LIPGKRRPVGVGGEGARPLLLAASVFAAFAANAAGLFFGIAGVSRT